LLARLTRLERQRGRLLQQHRDEFASYQHHKGRFVAAAELLQTHNDRLSALHSKVRVCFASGVRLTI